MSQRLVAAVAELAEAVAELSVAPKRADSWELVSEGEKAAAPKSKVEPPTSSVKASLPPSSTPVVAPSTAVCYKADIRHYIVVVNPGGPVGYHFGEAGRAWPQVEALLPGQRLAGSGAKLRRVQDREAALVIWERTHGKVPMPNLLK